MPHESLLTESQVRHTDEYHNEDIKSFADMQFESQARHVDEYRFALLHEESDESE